MFAASGGVTGASLASASLPAARMAEGRLPSSRAARVGWPWRVPVPPSSVPVQAPAPPRAHVRGGHGDLCIVSLNMPADGTFAALSAQNHAEYADRHGYRAYRFEGRVSGERFLNPARGDPDSRYGGGLTWQKLAALERVADGEVDDGEEGTGRRRCSWMMWLDADAIVTNMRYRLEDLIANFAGRGDKHVILAREESGIEGNFINSGAFFVRNSRLGRNFLHGVGALFDRYKDGPMTDQNAVQDYVFSRDPRGLPPEDRPALEAHTRAEVALAPQRAFDGFRWPFPPASATRAALWQTCDFIGHVAGHNPEQRQTFMEEMLATRDAC